jgi:CHAT domain-containing protein/tetratricopeptide (TPR) repeat protein
MGDLAGARPYYERALAIRENVLRPEHPDTAQSLNNLGALLQVMGDLTVARPYYTRALAIHEKVLGPEHPNTATSLNNLGTMLIDMGDLAGARPYYTRALAIREKVLGLEHPDTATSLNNLGALLRDMGDLAGARPYFERALAICEKALGPEHPNIAHCFNNLGFLLQVMGDLAGARPYYERALAIREKVLGPEHPVTAGSLNNLGVLLQVMGDVAGARPYYERALAIREKVLGPEHPDTAISLNNLATLQVALDQPAEALNRMRRAAAIDDRTIGQICSIGSDRQRMAFLTSIQGNMKAFLSLVFGYHSESRDAVHAALDLVLRRKGIAAAALAAQRDAILTGRYPHLEPRLRQWSQLRMQIALKRLAGPGREGRDAHEHLLADWTRQVEQMEVELARQIPEMNLEEHLRQADRRAVALHLEEGVCLVEFVRFHVFDFKAVAEQLSPSRWKMPAPWGKARYLAFIVLAKEPDKVQMIDLGEAEPIDRLIEDFRNRVALPPDKRPSRKMAGLPATSGAPAAADAGLRLREAVFDKLTPAFGRRKRLLLALDGNLTRIPFEVLPASEGGRLIDTYDISYLTTGRDVLRFGAAVTGQPSEPLVVADPDFDLGGAGFWSKLFGRWQTRASATAPGQPATPDKWEISDRVSRDLDRSQHHFNRLKGVRQEGERIAARLRVQPWLDRDALEGRLKKQCRSPRILHVTTHGFFLEGQPEDPNRMDARFGLFGGLTGEPGRLSGPLPENPLLRSGLALAGVNTWLRRGTLPPEAEDGLLTAEDVSGLDLLATELVVLPACDTGLGEVRTGEGVFGLQRSFVLAGAKTLVMSLWKVDDQATLELMEGFYDRLLAGRPRAAALHEAQQAVRAKYPDPYYWGAFVCLGDASPLRSVVVNP